VYTGIVTNDNLQTALQKIDQKFQDSNLGYIFTNGLEQLAPGQPVMLGGALVKNTTIGGLYNIAFAGTLEASALITTGGTSTDFVKGDGSLDPTSYQPSGNYITNLTGDVLANGPGSVTATLATVFGSPGTYGNSGNVPAITVDSKGRITNVTPTPINYPAQSLSFVGDVDGFGFTGSPVTLTLDTVNTDVYGSNNFLKFAVNGKGLITSATPVSGGDITTALGYVPVNDAIELSINGVAHDLTANRSWNVGTVTSVSITAGTGINASISNPNTTPSISIINTAPDQTVVLNGGFGISVTGSYPNFTVINDYPSLGGTVTSFSAGNLSPLFTTSVTNPTTTPALSFALANAAANTVLAGPNGGSGAPSFRALVAADIPSLSYISNISATAPLATTGGLTPTLSISQASCSTNGYLSSVDWTTFNDKEDALTKGNLTEAVSGVLTITGGTNAVIGTGTSIQVKQASGTQDGFLDSADWTTFNDKVSTSRSIGTTAPLQGGGNLSADRLLSITQSNSTTDGYLSSTDWNTFNDKTTCVGTVTSVALCSTTTGVSISGSPVTTSGCINVDVSTASASCTGLLTSTDWSTFNNKQDALGYTPVPDSRQLDINGVTYDLTADRCWSVGTVTSIATSAPLTGGTITNSGTLGITQSGAGTDGYLSSTDWNTFNNKQASGNYITDLTGDATASGPGSVALTLATVNATTGTFGSSTQVPVITVNNKGLVTCVTTDTISGSLEFIGDVTGTGSTGTCTSLTLATVNNDVYTSETLLNIAVNGKGLITSANPTSSGHICSVLGYTPEDVANKSTCTSLGSSNTLYPTQLAVKTYIDSATAGGIILQGDWNAATNTPDISGTTTTGFAWRVSVSGTTNLGGINDWHVGDLAVKSATGWVKIDNSDGVTSVFGRFGAVVATTGDYLTCQVTECGDLYYTDARVRAAIGHTAPLTYCSTTGVFGISQSNTTTDGYLSATDWTTFNDKQPLIVAGTTSQYYRGDKTFQTLDTSVVTEGTNLYFTDARARGAVCAGAGISYNATSGEIGNSCPDQIVSLTGGGTTSITGTYPNFTISSADCFSGTVTSVAVCGTNIGVTGSPITSCGIIDLSLSGTNVCSALGYTPTNSATTISTSAPLQGGGDLSSSRTLSITQSGASTDGYLSSTDWNTFNNKQSTLTNPVLASGSWTSNYVPKINGTHTLTNSLIYDGGTSIGINTASPHDPSQFKLDVNGGVLIKNTSGTAAQLTLINSDPAAGGNNGFVQFTAGGNTATTFAQLQSYYGIAIASGALRLQPLGGQVLVGTSTASAFTTDINGTVRVSGQLTLGSTITDGSSTYTLPSSTGTLALTNQLSGYVPYTGATTSVNLGTNNITARNYLSDGDGSTTGGYFAFKQYNSSNSGAQGYTSIYALGQTSLYLRYSQTDLSQRGVDLSAALLGNTTRQYLFPDKNGTFAMLSDITGTGTVTSVAALTLGTTGTDLSSTVANSTTTPVITLNVPTASATNRGALSSADWSTFNNKQNAISVTAPITLSGSTVGITQAGAASNGFLSSTDWNSFNSRTSCTGTVTCVNATGTNISVTGSPITTSGTLAISLSGANVCGALGYTPYNATNPNGYTSCVGTVTSVGVVATNINVCASPVTTSGNICLNLTGANVCSALGYSPTQGTGTTNYLPKFTGASTIGNSILFDNGTNVGINTTTPTFSTGYTTLSLNGSTGGQIEFKTGDVGKAYIYSNSTDLRFFTSGGAFRFDGGNLGLGVTPSAWGGGNVALDIGGDPFSGINASLRLGLTTNAYAIGATYYYRASGLSSQQYRLSVGTNNHEWYVAPSGTAGAAISYTQAMTLAANGNLTLGTTSSYTGVRMVAESTTGVAAWFITGGDTVPISAINNGGTLSTIGFKGTSTANAFNVRVGADGENFVAYTSNTERFRIASTGAATFNSTVTTNGDVNVQNGSVYAGLGGPAASRGFYAGSSGFQASFLYNNSTGNLDISPRAGFSTIFTSGTVTASTFVGALNGNATSATTTTFVASPDGSRNPNTFALPTTNPRSVRYDFATAGSVTGATGNYAGVMTYSPWDGTSASTGDSSYQLAFCNWSGVNASGLPGLALRNGINSSWNATWYQFLHSGNYTSYAPSLTGSGASGTWGINITGSSANITAYTINQNLGTGNGPTFTNIYNNAWFRNNNSNEGLYNQVTTQHLSSNTNGYWDMSSTTNISSIRFYTGGHVTSIRGYVYANDSNQIGFLNNAGSWSFRVDNSGNATVLGTDLTVGSSTSSNIYMVDSDEGTRRIHCNSNRIGFLTQAEGWGAWCNDNGSWESASNITAAGAVTTNDWFYVNGTGGLYFNSYGYGLRSPDAEGNLYGNIATHGSGRNGWAGYGIGSQFALMGRVSTDIGLHDIGYAGGWIFYSLYGTGRLSIGTSTNSTSYRLYVEGAIFATGDVVAFSDARKKNNIITIDNALEKVTNLRGVFYDKIGEEEKGRQLGVIAQEVNQVLPEAVSYANDIDEYGVKYGNFAGLFIEAFKEQQKQIEELKNIINVLTS
jgi:hypothetical protein